MAPEPDRASSGGSRGPCILPERGFHHEGDPRGAARKPRSVARRDAPALPADLRARDRRPRAACGRDGHALRRAHGAVLVEPFHRARAARRLSARPFRLTSARRSARMFSGRFEDMLLAVAGHVCMVSYLDNNLSFGPNSRAGRRSKTRHQREPRPRNPGTAYAGRERRLYAGRCHRICEGADRLDPRRNGRSGEGPARCPGGSSSGGGCTSPVRRRCSARSTPRTGIEEARAIMRDLARHPSTARFIADQAGAAFRGRRPARSGGRADRPSLSRDRRRPGPGLQRAGRSRRGLAGTRFPRSRRRMSSSYRPCARSVSAR